MAKEKGKRIGIVDLGTNSVRFDTHLIYPDGSSLLMHREKRMIRLGDSVYTRGRIQEAAIKRALRVFLGFKRECKNEGIKTILAFGTSALREAKNGKKLVQMILEKTGIQIQIISGREEARLISKGILPFYQSQKDWVALVDIGGGSTEISLCKEGKIYQSESLRLGVARLQQVFLKKSPPRNEAIKAIRKHIGQKLRSHFDEKRVSLLVASSGTARALSRLSKEIFGLRLSYGVVRELSESMNTLTRAQLLRMRGMEPKRAEFILAGAILFEEIVATLGCPKIKVTKLSLRDGILKEVISTVQNETT